MRYSEPRRLEFYEISEGWGGDDLPDLVARAELLAEWWGKNFPLSPAERKIMRAISKRLGELGGVELPEMH